MAAVRPPHILIADDEADLLEAFCEILLDEGYAVTSVASAEAALEAIDAQIFDAVVTDAFAEADALKPVSAIVARARPTPVGMLSGWKLPESKVKALGLRFALQKPFEVSEVLVRLAQMLNDPIDPATHEAAALARRYFEALERKDWDSLLALCSAYVRFAGPQGSRFAATLVGRDAFLQHSRETFETVFQDAKFRDLVIYPTPEGVAVRYLGSWTAGGKPAQLAGAAILRIEGGQVERVGVELNQALLDRLAP